MCRGKNSILLPFDKNDRLFFGIYILKLLISYHRFTGTFQEIRMFCEFGLQNIPRYAFAILKAELVPGTLCKVKFLYFLCKVVKNDYYASCFISQIIQRADKLQFVEPINLTGNFQLSRKKIILKKQKKISVPSLIVTIVGIDFQ